MRHVYLEKVENNRAILTGALGSNIFTEVIPQAIEQIKENGWEEAELKGLNGVDLKITKYMTAEDARDMWNIYHEANNKAYDIEERAYERSDDYKKEQEERDFGINGYGD